VRLPPSLQALPLLQRTYWSGSGVPQSVLSTARQYPQSGSAVLIPGDRYREAKRTAASAVAEAKARVWEEFGEAIEKDFQLASRRFWQTVR